MWTDIPYMPPAPERMGFGTQKPEMLLKRIISAASNKGDYVLDYFSGSGTTICTAHKLGRKWIGVEMGEHFYDVILPRLKRILKGDSTKLSKETNWKGGGFFKYYELEQYEDILRKSKYNPYTEDGNIFVQSEKLLDVLKIDKDNAIIDFKELYNDVDIAETISLMTGKKIKQIRKGEVIFTDGKSLNLDNITWGENKNLKPLFWWEN